MKLLIATILISAGLINFESKLEKPVDLFPKARIAKLSDLPKQVESREERLERLAYKYAVPESIWRLVYKYESSNGQNVKPNFEAHVPAWLLSPKRPAEFRAAVKDFATDKSKLKLLATSFGAMQVMGYHALSYGIDPIELATNPEVQDELGMVRLANAYHATRGKPKVERARLTGKAYNGGDKYAARMARDIGARNG